MRIIALGHKSRVGKSTAGKILLAEARLKGKATVCMGFADKLKAMSYDLYGWSGLKSQQHYEDYPADRDIPLPALDNKTPVQVWCEVGDALRGVYLDTWCEYIRTIKADLLIITDLRYINEMDIIQYIDPQALLVRVDRENTIKRDTPADNALNMCTSWTHILENNGNVTEFYEKVVKLLCDI